MNKNRNRSTLPGSTQFTEYMLSGWGSFLEEKIQQSEVAKYTEKRRQAVCALFPGKTIVVEAGDMRCRANDTFYRYRPDSSFTWLTGWGCETTPGAVLVIYPDTKPVLFFKSPAGKKNDDFFTDSHNGTFWIGSRPSLQEIETLLGITCRDIKDFRCPTDNVLLCKTRGKDAEEINDLKVAISELRLLKDRWEITQLQKAVDATAQGFERVVKSINEAKSVTNGERVIEGAFYTSARSLGYETGYETIVAAGANACILHWSVNNGPINDGDLLLVDAGIELETLYTADITRTVPISGKFTDVQAKVYEAVLEAADAAFDAAMPGQPFHKMHEAAMGVIRRHLSEWGICKASQNEFYRRYMIHGTGHHLGLDVHDCAFAKRENYRNGTLADGMVLTIEPGLYFHKNDLTVPKDFRGIGVRIEDNILIASDGPVNMSRDIPRARIDVEQWIQQAS